MPEPGRTRVLLVEDHLIIRQMLAQFSREQLGLDVCGEASSIQEAVSSLTTVTPDIVLIDWALPNGGGRELIRAIHLHGCRPRFVVLTALESPDTIRVAMESGASAFVLKRSGIEALRAAIDAALAGRIYFCPATSVLLAESTRPAATAGPDTLSAREREILTQIAAGRSPKEVASILGTSPKTVHNQIRSLKAKLGIFETAGLVRFAMRHGIFSQD